MIEEHEIDEALTPKHIALFEKSALRLARAIVLTSDWTDKDRIAQIKEMAENLIPKRWVSDTFNANT